MSATAGGTRCDASRARAGAERAARGEPAGRRRDPVAATARCSPKAGTAAPERTTPRSTRCRSSRPVRRAARRRSSPSSPATTPAAPARAPRPSSPPASRASSTPSPTRATESSGGGERLRAAGVDVESGVLADEADGAARVVADRAAPRPPARHRQVGAEPRRPGRGIRRHQPVDHRTGCARRRAPPPRRGRRDRRRHRHGARRRSRADRPRAPTARCFDAPADPRRHRRDARHRMPRRCAATRAARSSTPRATSPRCSRTCARAASSGCSSRAGRRSRARSSRAGPRRRGPRVRRAGAARRRPARAHRRRRGDDRATRGGSPSASVERLGDDLLVVAHPLRQAEGLHRCAARPERIKEPADVHRNRRGDRRRSPPSSRRATACGVTVRAPKAVSDAAHGDSISVSGVCLTVVDQGADWFTADVMKQTLDMSTLAGVAPGRAREPRARDRRARPPRRAHRAGPHRRHRRRARRAARRAVARAAHRPARLARTARRRQGLDRRRRRLAHRQRA